MTVRVLVAPASFKGSLSALAAAEAISAGARRASAALGRSLVLDVVPLADGGEGTVEAVRQARGGSWRRASARDPLGRPVDAGYLLLDDGTAVIEMAAASGLPLLAANERDPLVASTHGTGDLMAAAAAAGAGRLVIGVGGSATVDGGAGMAEALGVRFLDTAGESLPRGGGALTRLSRIDVSGLSNRVRGLDVEVLCDVNNPLLGPLGAAAIFGPQKGATPAMVEALDAALYRLATVIDRDLGVSVVDMPGAGAAGGLAAGLVAFLDARLRPGIEVIMELLDVPGHMVGSDLVITGEGKLDGQTVGGKVIAGVARVAAGVGVPLVAIAGCVTPEASALYDRGVTASFSLADGPRSLEESERDVVELLQRVAENVVRLWLARIEST